MRLNTGGRVFGVSVQWLGLWASAVCVAPVLATDWIEPRSNDGDAGAFVSAAQFPIGEGVLNSITGVLDGAARLRGGLPGEMDFQDLFAINIPTPTAFTARTVSFGFEDFNTQLFLFSFGGQGLLNNDNENASLLFSRLLPQASDGSFNLTSPGIYVIGIAGSGMRATAGGLDIFPSTPSTSVHGATGPGGAGTHDGWAGPETSGRYIIELTGAQYVPSAGSGAFILVGLGAVARRRRR